MPEYPERRDRQNRILTMMLAAQVYESYWIDKWHASPYYATAHVLIALMGMQEPLLAECHNSIEWLIHTQRSDGSWGFFDWGTIEETAYALLALFRYHRQVKAVDVAVLKRGSVYLDHCLAQKDLSFPELWVAKSLYAPKNIVKAATLAAVNLCQETLGRMPG
jgi:halimadienyl-diphosphate synthase